MNKAQVQAIEYLLEAVVHYQANGDPEGHEFKRIDIAEWPSFVSVTTVYGLCKDEGTLAAVCARDYRHFTIGTRGAITLRNSKRGRGNRKVRGRAALFEMTR
jgi:hypothetical protein